MENSRLRNQLRVSAQVSPAEVGGNRQDDQQPVRPSLPSQHSAVSSTPEFAPSDADAPPVLSPEARRQRSAVSRIFISANGDSSYHGVTSTLFDDASTDRPAVQVSVDPKMPVEWVKKGLMAEAARQRNHPLPGPSSAAVLTWLARTTGDEQFSPGLLGL